MSLSNDKNFMKQLDNDIENLSKLLYLDNPDLWMDFMSKSTDKNRSCKTCKRSSK